MKDTHNILKEYQEGDFEKRLFYFLECRSLRDDFVRIDHEELKIKKDTMMSKPSSICVGERNSAFYPFRRLLKWCHSFMN